MLNVPEVRDATAETGAQVRLFSNEGALCMERAFDQTPQSSHMGE